MRSVCQYSNAPNPLEWLYWLFSMYRMSYHATNAIANGAIILGIAGDCDAGIVSAIGYGAARVATEVFMEVQLVYRTDTEPFLHVRTIMQDTGGFTDLCEAVRSHMPRTSDGFIYLEAVKPFNVLAFAIQLDNGRVEVVPAIAA